MQETEVLCVMQESMHDADMPGKLPAYWPAACLGSSIGDTPTDISLSPEGPPVNHCHTCEADNDSPRADSQGAGGLAASAGKQHLKTYAELLSEETAAMKNAVGPWQPRLEKSSKLMVRVSCMHGIEFISFSSWRVRVCVHVTLLYRSMWTH